MKPVAVDKDNGARIDKQVLASERKKDFAVTRAMRFACRTRYFTDSGIIGTKAFVAATFQQFKDRYPAKKDKNPQTGSGPGGASIRSNGSARPDPDDIPFLFKH